MATEMGPGLETEHRHHHHTGHRRFGIRVAQAGANALVNSLLKPTDPLG